MLRELEKSATPPVVAGEVLAWTDDVNKTCGRADGGVQRLLSRDVATAKEIMAGHPEYAPQAEGLKETARKLALEWSELRGRLGGILQATGSGADSSAQPVAATEALREDLLAWITSVRVLEGEVQGWLSESLRRDVGGEM
jgi:hypothetical protein